MSLSLKNKIIALAVVAALLPGISAIIATVLQRQWLTAGILDEMNDMAKSEAAKMANCAYLMCRMSDQRTKKELRDILDTAHTELAAHGVASLADQRITWKGINQFTQESHVITLPALCFGTSTLIRPTTGSGTVMESSIVDAIHRQSRAHCTIFQRINPEGDMMRVATTLVATDGGRAIGTFIPNRNPDGTPNEVVATVLRGETYLGQAWVVNEWFAATYEPIRSEQGSVIGMLFVGFSLKQITSELREAIMSIVVGKTGYVYALGASGSRRGTYIVSKQGTRDGENIWEARDADGRFFIQSLVEKAKKTASGAIDFERYTWKNEGDTEPRTKVAAVTWFPPLDWVISAGVYEDDFHDLNLLVTRTIDHGISGIAVAVSLFILMAIALAVSLGGTIIGPMRNVIGAAERIAQGDLAGARADIAVAAKALGSGQPDALGDGQPNAPGEAQIDRGTAGGDEVGQLFHAVATMTSRLISLVGQVQRSCVQMVSTATELAATSKEEEASVADFSASTTQITAAVKEISATSRELVETMRSVTDAATQTASLADTGRVGLDAMSTSMRQLASATDSISGKLAMINEKTVNINGMVTTINKVADQTNLLSLNAAIEAEKAGEAGLGFGVVAREIRRLAEQTAVATLDIEQTVKEMQMSVAAGVMEMDKFRRHVAQDVGSVNDISTQLGQIIEQVKSLAGRFNNVDEGMRAQSTGAEQISSAMVQLSDAARNSTRSLRQFNDATRHLQDAAHALQAEVSRFKV
ncbi:MAG: methyl-accepting chemotaxis protein [Candidatus Ozemobacteraceae bacterium]